VIVPTARWPPPFPSIEIDESTNDEEEEDASQELRHFAMAQRNSLMPVVTNIWEKDKRRHRGGGGQEEWNLRKAKKASIQSEMASRGYVIVDYSDDESDLSDESIDNSDAFTCEATPPSPFPTSPGEVV
jgi:hypothetical protein